MRSLPALTLVLTVLTGAVAAEDIPSLFPERDVAITYRSTGVDSPPVEVSMSWMAARRLLRIDTPGVGWSVADQAGGTGFIVMEDAKRVVDMPSGVLRRQLGPTAEARFTREGTENIAGLSCTIWRYQDLGSEGRVCVTSDGVLLRSQGAVAGIPSGMDAVRVTYGAQDAARFGLPEGYQRVQSRQRSTR
ncbi:hypothetical protein [Roseococcus sp.]|uniref:hypothetical protein n=1 Tax=Roseococcus sp. TaxID=2109646 RepID=UPI003BAB62B8